MEELYKHTKQTALLRMSLYAETCLINLMTDGKMECVIYKKLILKLLDQVSIADNLRSDIQ